MISKPTEDPVTTKDKNEAENLSDITAQHENDTYARERAIMGLDALEAMYEDELCH